MPHGCRGGEARVVLCRAFFLHQDAHDLVLRRRGDV